VLYPLSVATQSPLWMSHTRMVQSFEPDTTLCWSNCRQRTVPVWPVRVRTAWRFVLMSQTLAGRDRRARASGRRCYQCLVHTLSTSRRDLGVPDAVVGGPRDDPGAVKLQARNVRGVALKGANGVAPAGPVPVEAPPLLKHRLPHAGGGRRPASQVTDEIHGRGSWWRLQRRTPYVRRRGLPLGERLPFVAGDPPRKVLVQQLAPKRLVIGQPPPQPAYLRTDT